MSMRQSNRLAAPIDFQEHVARLEERDLLVRIERPINKDTELHPLVRWQFVGGLKQFRWPRPPLVLGVVLGDSIERYLFISIERFGVTWFARPVVIILFVLAIVGLVRPFLQDVRIHGGIRRMLTDFQAPVFHWKQLFTIFILVAIAWLLSIASEWNFSARIVPVTVGVFALLMGCLSLFNDMCRRPETTSHTEGLADHAMHGVEESLHTNVDEKIHMDLTSDTEHLPLRTIATRAALFFGYLLGFMAVMSVIGLIPTAGLFVVLFMRVEGPERWSIVIPYAVILVLGIYIAFHQVMAVPWPPTLLGTWFPDLKFIPSM